jgi:hypothetical protein
MSSASSTTDTLAPDVGVVDAAAVGRRAVRSALHSAQFAAFCAAIALPLAYLPLLANGLPVGEAAVFGALLAAHLVALVVGHGYGDHVDATRE